VVAQDSLSRFIAFHPCPVFSFYLSVDTAQPLPLSNEIGALGMAALRIAAPRRACFHPAIPDDSGQGCLEPEPTAAAVLHIQIAGCNWPAPCIANCIGTPQRSSMLYGLPGDAADHFSSIVTLSSLPLDLNGTPLAGFTALANSSPRNRNPR
jgi:hypothetical protein